MALSLTFSQGHPVENRVASAAAAAAAGAIVASGNMLSVAHAPVIQGSPAVLSAGPARYKVNCLEADVPAEISPGPVYVNGDGHLTADDGKHLGYTFATIPINSTSFEIIVAPNGTLLEASA